MKKIIALFLCVIMVLSLAACAAKVETPAEVEKNEPAADTPKSEPAKEADPAASTDSSEVITLNVTSWRTDDAASWGEINAAFHEEYPNIEVIFNGVTATEYDSVLQTKLASGNAEDIIFLRAFSSGRQIFDAGYVLPLSEENIPLLASNTSASQRNPWTTEDGTVYGVPGSMCVGGFFYNKGIFEKCGITEAPATWEEFLADCQTIKDNGYIAIADGIKDSWFVTEYISSTVAPVTTGGSDWHTALMNKEVDWSDEGFVKSMDWIKQMSEYMPDNFESIGYDDAQMLFLSEAAAIYPSGSFDLSYLETTNPDIDLGWFFMPTENAGDALAINFGMIMGYGINASLKDDEAKLQAAYTYLNWLCDDAASSMFDNLVVGQYASNTAVASGIENALAAEILAGFDGQDLYQQMPYEKVSDESPDFTTVVTEAIYNLLVNGQSPEEVCEKMVADQAWYFGK